MGSVPDTTPMDPEHRPCQQKYLHGNREDIRKHRQIHKLRNTLVLYFKGKKINTDKGRIIYTLSMVVGGTNDVTTNWADLQRKLIVEEDDSWLKTWKDFRDALVAYFTPVSPIWDQVR
ncbi:hypothetical protein PM082_002339 [Marasmius tenuissimus]|nr:hypothetical protein PM082_002339 [Marasmius tenuissimus]